MAEGDVQIHFDTTRTIVDFDFNNYFVAKNPI